MRECNYGFSETKVHFVYILNRTVDNVSKYYHFERTALAYVTMRREQEDKEVGLDVPSSSMLLPPMTMLSKLRKEYQETYWAVLVGFQLFYAFGWGCYFMLAANGDILWFHLGS